MSSSSGSGRSGSRAAAPAPGFLLDLSRCVGCGACVLACRMENQVPEGVAWRRLLTLNHGRSPAGPTYHFTLACHHCQDPPCEKACPSGALEKGADGVVRLREELCLGCRYCEMACPFGAPSYDALRGVMTKCHLCSHRLEEGLLPACVEACPTGALRYSRDLVQEREMVEEDEEWRPGWEIPGFSDPAGAGPGLFLAEPGGQIRRERYEALRQALGLDGEARDGEARDGEVRDAGVRDVAEDRRTRDSSRFLENEPGSKTLPEGERE